MVGVGSAADGMHPALRVLAPALENQATGGEVRESDGSDPPTLFSESPGFLVLGRKERGSWPMLKWWNLSSRPTSPPPPPPPQGRQGLGRADLGGPLSGST